MAGDFTPLAGPFELRFGLRRFKGMAIGTVTANGDNTFDVDATLDIQSGGSGIVQYHGRLDHNVFPPTLIGKITQ
jgi:hypothetical protein